MVKINALNSSPLKKWVWTNKYFIKTSEPKEKKAEATHYLLDGGIWKIPLSEYQTFLQLLSKDLHAGEKHYISENRTPVFKFICDLDFYEESIITIKQVEHIVKIIQGVVNEHFSDQRIIVCGADSKQVIKDNVEYTKSGFHLVFPKLWLTSETAKKIRYLCVKQLVETFGERESFNTWEDVVDLSVYEDNGLRMVGCRKINDCKVCKNKKGKKELCESCDGVGKKDENRVYKPISVLPENEEYLNSIKNDYYVMLLETSIYNYAQFSETESIKEIDVTLPTVNKKGGGGKKTKIKTINTNEIDSKIQNFIHKNYKEHYSECSVKKVNLNKDSNYYYVEIDDNFCMNVNRQHTSSNIYFQIRPSGISQRCYCKKETVDGRLHGLCKEYASKEIALPAQLKKVLFGNEIVSKKNKTLVNCNVTKSLDKESYLDNCKNILWQLKHELL